MLLLLATTDDDEKGKGEYITQGVQMSDILDDSRCQHQSFPYLKNKEPSVKHDFLMELTCLVHLFTLSSKVE